MSSQMNIFNYGYKKDEKLIMPQLHIQQINNPLIKNLLSGSLNVPYLCRSPGIGVAGMAD